jgi:hypothetical protein
MHLETKFLRLRTPVTLGSWFGDWQVTWLGGWTRERLSYLVMVVHLPTAMKNGTNEREAPAAPRSTGTNTPRVSLRGCVAA